MALSTNRKQWDKAVASGILIVDDILCLDDLEVRSGKPRGARPQPQPQTDEHGPRSAVSTSTMSRLYVDMPRKCSKRREI